MGKRQCVTGMKGMMILLVLLFSSLIWATTGQAETIAAGYCHSLTLKTDGTVWASGINIGNTPVQITGLSSIVALCTERYHHLALKNDGTVWAWGENTVGQLGDGTTTDRIVPVQVTGLSNVVALSVGLYDSLALKSDGTLWAWGWNAYGELGDGTATRRLVPVQVTGLSNVVALSVGLYHSLALKSDGTVWAWGRNIDIELGGGTTADRTFTPVQVPGLSNIVALAAAQYHSEALKSDGTVWTWGTNINIRPGYTIAPVQVPGLSNVVALAAGQDHSMALKSDGTVWAWGDNDFGELGDDTQTDRNITPVQVHGLSNVVDLSAGTDYSMALKSDGTVWAWGWNGCGQFGNGTINDGHQKTPVLVGDGHLVPGVVGQSPSAPTMQVQTSGQRVTVSWGGSTTATGYTLYYAPYPDPTYIGSAAMGSDTSFSIDLWSGAAFYVAVTAGNSNGNSGYSNIEHFVIP